MEREEIVIGEIVQHILDRQFQLTYCSEFMGNAHRFMIRKYYGGQDYGASWVVSDLDLVRAFDKDFFLAEADKHMAQVDEMITQHRLIEEALS